MSSLAVTTFTNLYKVINIFQTHPSLLKTAFKPPSQTLHVKPNNQNDTPIQKSSIAPRHSLEPPPARGSPQLPGTISTKPPITSEQVLATPIKSQQREAPVYTPQDEDGNNFKVFSLDLIICFLFDSIQIRH